MIVGLIADTHGLLRPEAVDALQGSDLIVHAGDVGDPVILSRLAAIAPVSVVRGNVDRGLEAAAWPLSDVVQAGEVRLYVLHDLATLDLDPATAEIDVVISGHSHVPSVQRQGGVLFVNPGSAGPRRFSLPISVARLVVTGREVSAQLIDLAVCAPPAVGPC